MGSLVVKRKKRKTKSKANSDVFLFLTRGSKTRRANKVNLDLVRLCNSIFPSPIGYKGDHVNAPTRIPASSTNERPLEGNVGHGAAGGTVGFLKGWGLYPAFGWEIGKEESEREGERKRKRENFTKLRGGEDNEELI